MVHIEEMILPQVIQGLENYQPLYIGHLFLPKSGHLCLIGLFRSFGYYLLQCLWIKLLPFLLGDVQSNAELSKDTFLQGFPVPLFRGILFVRVDFHQVCRYIVNKVPEILAQTLTRKYLFPLPVDHFPLLVHDIVIIEEVFPDLEVLAFNLSLGILNGLGQHRVLYGLSFLHPKLIHNPGDTI